MFFIDTYAKAIIRGSGKYPEIHGYAAFVPYFGKTMMTISVYGLPREKKCECEIFALHIHEGGSCTGNADDPFANAKSHYDPEGCPHPCHSGDLPPLYADDGSAHAAFLTGRFTPEEIIGKTIIIHAKADDLHSQPSGNSGEKIACGVIEKMKED
ncbi:MAG: superoxide dismutase family protein [Oscillospiraceae bacterium]|nr:superoxide dismutase family protein [Oscillospiraceae bacterium]